MATPSAGGPADPGGTELSQDETFARAKAAIDAGRAELERSHDLFERARQLVDEAHHQAGLPPATSVPDAGEALSSSTAEPDGSMP